MVAVGDQLAHYRVEQLLGAGGMGEVYVAFDLTLERRVALKLLPESRALYAESRMRMLREARAASALAHPGIVTVYEIGEAAGRTYISMELVDGETLAHVIAARGALPPAEAVALFRQIGDAIVAAHAAGILHRDLKTANLMLTKGGRVKVLDFGLSKRLGAPTQPPLAPPPPARVDAQAETVSGEPAPIDPRGETVTPELDRTVPSDSGVTPSGDVVTVHGARMGTPGSAAPELMDGEDADVRSDVFSLGVVLHELVTGKPPFPWTSWEDIRLRILERRYQRSSHERLDAVIARALAPRREERHATVSELVIAAEAAVAERRARWPIFAGVGACAIGAAVAGVIAWPSSRAKPAEPDAGPPGPVTSAMTLPAPTPLTTGSSCAYSPVFADDHTVVYDVTPPGGTSDLWSIDVAGGPAVQLTTAPGMEWRAAAGLTPGHVVALYDDDTTGERGVIEVDLAHKTQTILTKAWSPGAASVRGDVYYLIAGGSELRRIRSKIDEAVTTIPDERGHPEQLAAAPDGARIALVGPPPDVPLMLVDLASGKLTALPAAAPGNTRPAFSTIAPAIYYLGAAGVRRIGLDGKGDELIGPKLRASGGLAISPDGTRLVYSSCDQVSRILDVATGAELVKQGYVSEPAVGPDGWLAWIAQEMTDAVLMVRSPDGKVEQLTTRSLGRVSAPAIAPDAKTIAFSVSGGDHPGVQVLSLGDEDGSTRRVFGMTGGDQDVAPLYLGDDLVFTRYDDHGFPYVFRTPVAGGKVEEVTHEPGAALTVTGNGMVLIGMGPDHSFEVWNPKKPTMARLTLPGELVGMPRFSANGEWIVVTAEDAIYRLHLDRPGMGAEDAIPEKVMDVPPDGTAGYATITNDGHVIAAPMVWTGELYTVSAPTNARW